MYVHYHGKDAPGFGDSWGGCESTHSAIQTVGGAWNAAHTSPRMQFGDISKQGGGSWEPDHHCHENGLDVDVRYVRNDGQEGPLDLGATPAVYSESLTRELLRLWADSGVVESIEVDQAAGISPEDVPGVTLVIDESSEHSDHFHVRLKDPDGADSNVC